MNHQATGTSERKVTSNSACNGDKPSSFASGTHTWGIASSFKLQDQVKEQQKAMIAAI